MSQRPLSPHLQIYKPQITSMMSILHRVTGVVLSFGLLLLAYWIISAAYGETAFTFASAVLGSWFGKLIMFGWTLALFYHLCNGIRHLCWDAGYGFDLETVDLSSKLVIGGAVVLTLAVWLFS
ncbi:MAG: succinate dehydrogenase, cytochrome b556 subunit [Arenicellales bacterium WSBS_2016_MAG_OTU3]